VAEGKDGLEYNEEKEHLSILMLRNNRQHKEGQGNLVRKTGRTWK
jgi:hypothetical protein